MTRLISSKMIRPVVICLVCLAVTLPCRSVPLTDNNGRRYCNDHQDCGSMNICDHRKFCRFINSFAELKLKIPCIKTFKQFCLKDENCRCESELFICEDNECVVGKERASKAYRRLLQKRRTEKLLLKM